MTRFVVLFLFIALLNHVSAAAGTDQPFPLSLQQAQELAMKNHPRITQAELAALASKEVVRESRSGFFPVITANVTAAGTSGDNTRIGAGGLNNSLILAREAEGVNISQLITDFGRTANLTASSKLQARAQEQNALATRAQILLAVDSAYFDALQAQSILDVARQTVATRQVTFDRVNELAKNKLRSGLDVSFARVDLDSSKLLLANANNDLLSAFANLSNVLGDRQQQNYRLVDEPVPMNPSLDDSQLVQATMRDRPDLIQLRLQRDAALRFARAEKDLHYPTISAVGSAGLNLPSGDPGIEERNYAAAGVNLSIPAYL